MSDSSPLSEVEQKSDFGTVNQRHRRCNIAVLHKAANNGTFPP
jgi:hypothetical protein